MLFRFLLIVSLLLASVEGAPINIRRHDSWRKIPAGFTNHLIFGPCSKTCGIGTRMVYRTRGCPQGQDKCYLRTEQCEGPEECGLDGIHPPIIPWSKVIIYFVAFTIIIFILGAYIGVICSNIRIYLKKDKSRRNDEDKETSDKPIGKHEDAPMVKKRDVIENTNISTPDRDYAVINIEPDKDVVISSDRKHEDKTKIVTDDTPHGPMVEKRDNLKSTMIPIPDAGDEVINMGPDEDVVTTCDKKHENILIIGNDEAARGPMAEKSDSLQNTEINKQWIREKIAYFEGNQNVIINSDRKHGPMAEKSDIKNTKINKQWLRDKIAKFEAHQNVINSDSRAGCCCEPTMYMGSSWRRQQKEADSGLGFCCPHWI